MCNLYDASPVPIRSDNRWAIALAESLSHLPRQYALSKTDTGAVITSSGDVAEMSWGFLRDFSNSPINNCRADKLDGEMWSDAWQNRRCVIPVRTYYEWKGGKGKKQTYAFQASDGESWLWAAGIWEELGGERFYTMITTEPGTAASAIHNRMPALLTEADTDAFFTAEDPKHLIHPTNNLTIFPCQNPRLKTTKPGAPIRDEPEPDLFPEV